MDLERKTVRICTIYLFFHHSFFANQMGGEVYYITPSANLVNIDQMISKQQSGTEPLNPNCDPSVNCDFEGIGYFCFASQSTVGVDVRYFLPGRDCLIPSTCVIKIDGNVMSCTAESECTNASCANQPGSLVHCSGTIPNVNGCDIDVKVECGENDIATCIEFN